MTYKVLGPRVIVKVPKVQQYYQGTSIAMPDDVADKETASQTLGEIYQIGSGALTNEDYGLVGEELKVGDKVHFQRYGAIRLKSKELDTDEFWVLNGKDLLCIEVQNNE